MSQYGEPDFIDSINNLLTEKDLAPTSSTEKGNYFPNYESK